MVIKLDCKGINCHEEIEFVLWLFFDIYNKINKYDNTKRLDCVNIVIGRNVNPINRKLA